MPLDEWQEQALEAAMGERADGRWASKFVGVSAPRQNGKSQLIVARALAGVLLFKEKTILISAHETDTAREVWKRLLDVIEDNPNLERRVSARMDAINRESLSFGRGKDRQTIKLKARRASGARGFSADCLLLDEAQILDKSSWGSIVPTMSAMPNPQLWLFGTPPTETDQPFAWERVRESSLARKARHCWLEWAAADGDDIDDAETWAKANPAFGVRISYEACADDRAAMDDDQFRRERLGMWSTGSVGGVIPSQAWSDVADPASVPVDRLALGVEVGPDLGWASVALAGQRADGSWHVALEANQDTHGPGVEWLTAYVSALVAANPQIRAVMVDAAGPVAPLLEQRAPREPFYFKGTRIKVGAIRSADLGAACSALLSGVVTGDVHHINQRPLSTAALAAGKRPLADSGLWVWSRRGASSDITPIQAATLALHGAQQTKTTRPSPQARRKVVVRA